MSEPLNELLVRVRACTLCADQLPLGPRPVFQLDPKAKILIAGQAPGKRVHETGKPFDDPSGRRLREWLGIDADAFYDDSQVAILPMGFCYPGTGSGGDLPPTKRCAETWREQLLAQLASIELTVLIGSYAQAWHLGSEYQSVTETVSHWKDYLPRAIPLPHPSPRNNIWLKKNLWFEQTVVPALQARVQDCL